MKRERLLQSESSKQHIMQTVMANFQVGRWY